MAHLWKKGPHVVFLITDFVMRISLAAVLWVNVMSLMATKSAELSTHSQCVPSEWYVFVAVSDDDTGTPVR